MVESSWVQDFLSCSRRWHSTAAADATKTNENIRLSLVNEGLKHLGSVCEPWLPTSRKTFEATFRDICQSTSSIPAVTDPNDPPMRHYSSHAVQVLYILPQRELRHALQSREQRVG